MAGVALLDVNVLVALFFPEHVHHELAHDWFADHRQHGWATCTVTENGFVRVAAQQPSEEGLIRPSDAIAHLTRFCADAHHHRWADGPSITDEKVFAFEHVGSHRMVTDAYLLGMAKKMKGCLVTFDQAIPLKAVRGATAAHLRVISHDL